MRRKMQQIKWQLFPPVRGISLQLFINTPTARQGCHFKSTCVCTHGHVSVCTRLCVCVSSCTAYRGPKYSFYQQSGLVRAGWSAGFLLLVDFFSPNDQLKEDRAKLVFSSIWMYSSKKASYWLVWDRKRRQEKRRVKQFPRPSLAQAESSPAEQIKANISKSKQTHLNMWLETLSFQVSWHTFLPSSCLRKAADRVNHGNSACIKSHVQICVFLSDWHKSWEIGNEGKLWDLFLFPFMSRFRLLIISVLSSWVNACFYKDVATKHTLTLMFGNM